MNLRARAFAPCYLPACMRACVRLCVRAQNTHTKHAHIQSTQSKKHTQYHTRSGSRRRRKPSRRERTSHSAGSQSTPAPPPACNSVCSPRTVGHQPQDAMRGEARRGEARHEWSQQKKNATSSRAVTSHRSPVTGHKSQNASRQSVVLASRYYVRLHRILHGKCHMTWHRRDTCTYRHVVTIMTNAI
jgi:hypothetical protein